MIAHLLLIMSADATKQDYTTGNLIRMCVAGLVLVALLAILVELAQPSGSKQERLARFS